MQEQNKLVVVSGATGNLGGYMGSYWTDFISHNEGTDLVLTHRGELDQSIERLEKQFATFGIPENRIKELIANNRIRLINLDLYDDDSVVAAGEVITELSQPYEQTSVFNLGADMGMWPITEDDEGKANLRNSLKANYENQLKLISGLSSIHNLSFHQGSTAFTLPLIANQESMSLDNLKEIALDTYQLSKALLTQKLMNSESVQAIQDNGGKFVTHKLGISFGGNQSNTGPDGLARGLKFMIRSFKKKLFEKLSSQECSDYDKKFNLALQVILDDADVPLFASPEGSQDMLHPEDIVSRMLQVDAIESTIINEQKTDLGIPAVWHVAAHRGEGMMPLKNGEILGEMYNQHGISYTENPILRYIANLAIPHTKFAQVAKYFGKKSPTDKTTFRPQLRELESEGFTLDISPYLERLGLLTPSTPIDIARAIEMKIKKIPATLSILYNKMIQETYTSPEGARIWAGEESIPAWQNIETLVQHADIEMGG